MGLFRQTGTRSGDRGARTTGSRAEARATKGQSRVPSIRNPRSAIRFFLWLVAGIAVMAGGGYLVAALWLFPAPLSPSERVVPRLMGASEREAVRQLERLGFRVIMAREPHTSSDAGIVTWQDPPPGVAAPRESEVRLTVSSGIAKARVPDVSGMDLDLAVRILGAVGLRLDGVDTVVVKGRMPGTAAGTSPAAGDSVTLGRGVIVHLAR